MRLTTAILVMLPLLVAESICAPVQPRAVTDAVKDKPIKARDVEHVVDLNAWAESTWAQVHKEAPDRKARSVERDVQTEPHKDEPDWKARDVERDVQTEPHKDEPDWKARDVERDADVEIQVEPHKDEPDW